MKIAIIGTRGIPNHYGGFEQFAEYIAPMLARSNYHVTVYCSSNHPFKEHLWHGVHLEHMNDPEKNMGAFGQFIYDLNCILHARKQQYDIILQLGYTSSSIWGWLLPPKSIIITNMDGLEWKRSKYSSPVQFFLKKAEAWAVNRSHYLISDSLGIQDYILHKYKKNSTFIAYGAIPFNTPNPYEIEKFGLNAGEYNILIARMEPENNIETILKASKNNENSKRLIVVGNYETTQFGQEMYQKYNSNKITFTGAIYDIQTLNNLRYYSHLYFHGHSVGGTNPSLLEAMASNCTIVAHDNIFNRSVLGNEAYYFKSHLDLSSIIADIPNKNLLEHMIKSNLEKITAIYSWENIYSKLDTLFNYCYAQRTKNDRN